MPSREDALPTQQFIDIEAVENGVLLLRGGSMRQIVAVSGLNFDLKSEDEQNAIIFSYQNFLNSLNFTLQIFIHSRKVNIDGYLAGLKGIEAGEMHPLLKTQLAEYGEFIRSFVAENAIMQKSFYVVVPYDVVEIGGVSSSGGALSFLKKKKSVDQTALSETEQSESRKRNMGQLSQRVEQVIAGLQQIGLASEPLEEQAAIELFYNLYNPENAEKKGLSIDAARDN